MSGNLLICYCSEPQYRDHWQRQTLPGARKENILMLSLLCLVMTSMRKYCQVAHRTNHVAKPHHSTTELVGFSHLNPNYSFTFPVIAARYQCSLEAGHLDHHTHLQIPGIIGLS